MCNAFFDTTLLCFAGFFHADFAANRQTNNAEPKLTKCAIRVIYKLKCQKRLPARSYFCCKNSVETSSWKLDQRFSLAIPHACAIVIPTCL